MAVRARAVLPAPGGDPTRPRAALRCRPSRRRRHRRARGCGRSGCAVGCDGHVRPRTVRVHPGRNAETPGPQKLQSPATIAGRPSPGSCGQQPAQLGGRAVGEARREVHADEVDRRAVDVEHHVQPAALGRGVAGHGADREAAAAPRRGCGSRSPARRRRPRHRRGGRGARVRAGPGRSVSSNTSAPIGSPNACTAAIAAVGRPRLLHHDDVGVEAA